MFHWNPGRAGAALAAAALSIVAAFGAPDARAQGWPALQTSPEAAQALAVFKRGPYGQMAKGRVAHATLVKGIYAIADPTGRYGPIFTDARATRMKNGGSAWLDVASGKPLADAQVRSLRRDMAAGLDLSRAIAFRYGSGTERAVLVSAYDCPYCRQLEQTLDGGSFDATVHLFPMSLQHNRPGSMAIARDIWCSADPATAWKAALLRGEAPVRAAPGCDKDARDAGMLLALFDIKAVPARIGPDGTVTQFQLRQ